MRDDLSFSAISASTQETLKLPPQCEGRVWKHSGPSIISHPHRHVELEANIATRGTASYLVGSTRLDLKPGTLLWLFPSADHILLSKSPDFEMWIAVWTPAFTVHWCKDEAVLLTRPDAPPRFHSRLSEADKTALETVASDIAHATGDPARCNAGLAYLLLSLWKAHERAEMRGEVSARQTVHPAVEKTVHLLRDETEPLCLEEIARRAGISAGRLSHLFRAQTGQTIAEFRNRQRVARFLRLCDAEITSAAAHPASLLTNALEAGFGSYAQFFRVFRSVVGCAPAEYFR